MDIEQFAKKYLEEEIKHIKNSPINDYKDLTLEDKALIYKYSEGGYLDLNEGLRKHLGKIKTPYAKLLNKCLTKLPDYVGLVYRCANLNSVELAIYKNAEKLGTNITEHSFISTSKSQLTANGFGANTRFQIYSRTGKEIEKFTKFGLHNPSNEKEVLFRSGKSFNILQITSQGDYTIIIMEEV